MGWMGRLKGHMQLCCILTLKRKHKHFLTRAQQSTTMARVFSSSWKHTICGKTLVINQCCMLWDSNQGSILLCKCVKKGPGSNTCRFTISAHCNAYLVRMPVSTIGTGTRNQLPAYAAGGGCCTTVSLLVVCVCLRFGTRDIQRIVNCVYDALYYGFWYGPEHSCVQMQVCRNTLTLRNWKTTRSTRFGQCFDSTAKLAKQPNDHSIETVPDEVAHHATNQPDAKPR